MLSIKNIFPLKALLIQSTFIGFILATLATNALCDAPTNAAALTENNSSKTNDDNDFSEEEEDYEEGSDEKNNDTQNEGDTVEPFPISWLKPAAATLGSSTAQNAPSTDKALFTVIGYFSPTCGHCGHFFRTELPEIQIKYINPEKIKLGIRPYCHHPIDFIVTQLAASRGFDQFLGLFSLFMKNQSVWFELLYIPMAEKEKRKKIIDAMVEKLPASVDRKKALIQFNINEENPSASVLLFALSNGFSIEEVEAATNSSHAQEIADQLIVAVLAAKDADGKAVQAVPTFYVNDAWQDNPLNLDDFESLAKTGHIVPRPKEPTQTILPSATSTQAATQVFSSITPPQ